MSSFRPQPVSDAALADLGRRLTATRLPDLPKGAGWRLGTDIDYLADLIGYWRTDYDWRAHEAQILELPWEQAGSGERQLRFLHQRSTSAVAPVVVLLHGWPDSVLRFQRVLPLLADCHVIVPALPGFPWAPAPTSAGLTVRVIASIVAEAMDHLGYDRYVLSGGDVGGDVAEHLADLHPDRVAALHLTNISPLHAVFADRSNLSDTESAYLDRVALWQRTEGGYIAQQSSKPRTLAVGLADSPAGLAAWLLEKLRSWSDHDGNVETAFPRNDLLTWISAYWLTGSIGTSFSTYANFVPPVPYINTPTLISAYAHDSKPAPREFAERFLNITRWNPHRDGGHFAAWEQPDTYAADLHQAITLAHTLTNHPGSGSRD